jgi:EmrB/QacA subfamily drug resistance transporter
MSQARSIARRMVAPRTTGAGATSRRLGLALVVIATAQLMVVLDATIVNVALPHIQRALGFSGTGLEWVVYAYAVAFGGLLLLGGRAGDLLGRRRMFIAGLVLFSAASLAGGFATSQAWLLTARAVQGAAAAVVAPAALALIATTFPEGKPRNQAMGVYATMSVAGSVVGLVAGGLLVTYASWRWVLFVNVPIGAVAALAALRVLPDSARQAGRFDLPGAITGTAGVAALVYGLSNAATTSDGISHWGDAKVVASLTAAAVLLAAFAVIEVRSRHALLPVRLLRSRDRSGANLIMLCVGTSAFGMYFFMTLFMQLIWGYSALRTGMAYLPYTAAVVVASGAAVQLVPRIGARPLLLAGATINAGGLYWQAQVTEHSSYLSGMLGASLVNGAGLGLLFPTLTLVGLAKVRPQDTGVASSLLNAGLQIGGAIGLAVLGTVAWTVVAHSLRAPASYGHALAAGFSRAFLGGALVMLLALAIAVSAIRVRRADLAGASEPTAAQPHPAPGSPGSNPVQHAATGSQPYQPSNKR